MHSPVQSPATRDLKSALAAGLTLLAANALFGESASQSDLDALKARMDQMQKQYEQRIDKMDQERKQDKEQISRLQSEVKALESKASSGQSILNTRILADAEGKGTEAEAKGPILSDSFLKTLTRNFAFTVYTRAGFQVNGSGGGGNFHFEVPDGSPGRFRLGNENDFYTELSFNQSHILGEALM
jgi:cell division protein FtsB